MYNVTDALQIIIMNSSYSSSYSSIIKITTNTNKFQYALKISLFYNK